MDSSVHLTNIFDSISTPAQAILELSWLVLWICAGIFVVVGGLLVYTLIRFRRRRADDDEPPQVYGSSQIELAWTVIPLLTVCVLFLVTTQTIHMHFLADIQNTALSATLVFSERILYLIYLAVPRVWGISALDDQATAGVIMWVPGALAYLVPVGWLVMQLLDAPQARSEVSSHQEKSV